MEQFRTVLRQEKPLTELFYHQQFLSLGSCFADHIGRRLQTIKYPIQVNPFGTLYNPISIRNSLALLLNNYSFVENDLFQHQGLWHSFQHHSQYSHPDKSYALHRINESLQAAREKMEQLEVLCITLGSAWVYELKDTQRVVSNCHKLPDKHFVRRRLSVQEIIDSLEGILDYIRSGNPKLNVIFTVSPVRHLGDGLLENQLSKASLRLAVESLQQNAPNTYYFPAYELLMDDLRDYRFYARDMIHPNDTAVDYIWGYFERLFLAPKEAKRREEVDKMLRAAAHKPFQPQSEAHQKFVHTQLKKLERLEKALPKSDWTEERARFEGQLLPTT